MSSTGFLRFVASGDDEEEGALMKEAAEVRLGGEQGAQIFIPFPPSGCEREGGDCTLGASKQPKKGERLYLCPGRLQ